MEFKVFVLLILFGSNFLAGQSANCRSDNKEEGDVSSVRSVTYEPITINDGILLPEDSLEQIALLASINGFLSAAQENSENTWMLASEAVETQMLIDEIQGIQKDEKYERDAFFKP
ncbi:MAG: hypothetical protein AAFZ52_12700, partial [Bacteroidota bacterium]